jgi:hypothetical protein
MAYITIEHVIPVAYGERRLFEMLKGTGDTASAHPELDRQLKAAEQEIDQALRRGGFETPLATPLQDETLVNAGIGVALGAATRGLSSREPWVDAMEKAGRAHLKAIGDGLITSIVGAELAEDPTQTALMERAHGDEPLFDLTDPYSPVHDVFPSLGQPRRG